MYLEKILDVDLHRAKNDSPKTPLILDIPAKPEFLPIVSSTLDFGKFIAARKLSNTGHVRSGVFNSGSNVDSCIGPLFTCAYDLSKSDGFNNIFRTSHECYNYILESSGLKGQPHAFLGPPGVMSDEAVKLGVKLVIPVENCIPTFLSRPDFVGLYTMFLGGKASIVLHNVALGCAFWENG
jgi:hypothetical protein